MLSDHEEKPEGAPEWMVSFADMITILMAFFVVMFSIASGDSNNDKRTKQQETVLESLQSRFGPKWKPFMTWNVMPGNSNLPGSGKGLGSKLPVPAVGDPGGTMAVKKKERARIKVPGQGDTIAIGGLVMFEASSAKLAAGQEKTIGRITEELAGKQQVVEIVATASNCALPLGGPYRDRWELAMPAVALSLISWRRKRSSPRGFDFPSCPVAMPKPASRSLRKPTMRCG